MAVKPDASGYENFSDVTARLDEIVTAVRNKDTSLERVAGAFAEVGLAVRGACASPIHGAKGNHEFLLLGVCGGEPADVDFPAIVSAGA